jgi:transcriptional regulator with XRE-family HTH domain
MLRVRREQLRLSRREAARRIGISPSYLLALEDGRNPSTGRAPVPSPPIVAAIARELDIELGSLLEASGASVAQSTHVLVYQLGAKNRSVLNVARSLYGDVVDTWVEVIDPRRGAEVGASPEVIVVEGSHQKRSMGDRPPVFDGAAAVEELCTALSEPAFPGSRGGLGVIFASSSAVLRTAENAATVLEGEATWEHDVAAGVRAVLGAEPVANLCVYRESDIEELAPSLDPLATLLSLVQSHPHVVLQAQDDRVTTGPAAIERILGPARPAGVSTATWESLTRAAAVGLAREATITEPRFLRPRSAPRY